MPVCICYFERDIDFVPRSLGYGSYLGSSVVIFGKLPLLEMADPRVDV